MGYFEAPFVVISNNRLKTLASLLLATLLTSPVWTQEWSKGRVIVRPGISAGPVKVGEKPSSEAQTFLGPPSKTQAPGDGSPGYSLFGKGDARDLVKGIRLRQGDAKNPEKTTAIEIKGLRAGTEEGVFLGGSANLVSSKYPQAQRDSNVITGNTEWIIPGLTMRLKNDKISEFVIEPAVNHAWRFQDLRVVAGQSAGPLAVGKVVSPEAFKLLGEPTFQVAPGHSAYSGIIRWSLPGQTPARMIEVILHDGVRPKVITQIRLRGIAAITDREVKLGDTASAVQSLYHEGRSGLHTNVGSETWRVPGLTFVIKDGKVYEIQIYKAEGGGKQSTRPR